MKTPSSPIYADNPAFLGVCASQTDTITFGNCATAYGNFALASYDIDRLAWVGGAYLNPAGVITGCTLTFDGDAGDRPGTVQAT